MKRSNENLVYDDFEPNPKQRRTPTDNDNHKYHNIDTIWDNMEEDFDIINEKETDNNANTNIITNVSADVDDKYIVQCDIYGNIKLSVNESNIETIDAQQLSSIPWFENNVKFIFHNDNINIDNNKYCDYLTFKNVSNWNQKHLFQFSWFAWHIKHAPRLAWSGIPFDCECLESILECQNYFNANIIDSNQIAQYFIRCRKYPGYHFLSDKETKEWKIFAKSKNNVIKIGLKIFSKYIEFEKMGWYLTILKEYYQY